MTKREKNHFLHNRLHAELNRKLKKDWGNKGADEFGFEEPSLEPNVSPWCREEVYRNYLEGWTIKDLSYKYGILPERVKSIIWMRDYFWKYVYPKNRRKWNEKKIKRRLRII